MRSQVSLLSSCLKIPLTKTLLLVQPGPLCLKGNLDGNEVIAKCKEGLKWQGNVFSISD